MDGYWGIRISMTWSKSTIRETSGIIILPTVPWINLSLMDKGVSSVLSQNLSLISSLNNVRIVLKICSLILIWDSVHGCHITQTSKLYKTGLSRVCLFRFLKKNYFLVHLKGHILMERNVKFVWCLSIGVLNKMLVSNVQQELYLMLTNIDVKSLKQTTWQSFKVQDGLLMTAILPE